MIHRHPQDPIALHHAAEQLGNIVARDEMTDADASATIISWVAPSTGVDKSGLQARLHWSMRDQAEAARRAEENATTAIRWAVRPLIRDGASKAQIEEAAGQANGGALEWDDIVPILKDEWLAVHARRRRG